MKPLTVRRIVLAGLLFLVLCAASYSQAAGVGQMIPGIESDIFAWRISDAKVVNPGITRLTDQGIITEGFAIEAAAEALQPSTPVARGKFSLKMTVFSPSRDMPGQKAGNWYLQGEWTIIDRTASREAKKSRHGSFSVNGFVSSELGFNPISSTGAVEAAVRLPRSPQGGRWASGEGTFQGNGNFEGTILVDAMVWPDVMTRR